MITIDKSLSIRKDDLLTYFRERGEEALKTIERTYGVSEFRDRARAINMALIETKNNLTTAMLQKASKGKWTNTEIVSCILMMTYTNDIVMLELRNEVWPYEYMTFSRRIGELWEPFCKLCFEYPIRELEFFVPLLFSEVKQKLTNEIEEYIDTLGITREQKEELKRYYDKVWKLVPEKVDLELDLHFEQEQQKFVVDFKSGFSSNEKGNTNRLLLVASVYKNLGGNYRCLLLVRAEEDRNNNYFRTLKNSGIWEAHCGDETYTTINEHSGFDLKRWIETNIDWESDFKAEAMEYFRNNNLEQYLKW